MTVLAAYGDATYGAGTYGGVPVDSTPTWAVLIPDNRPGAAPGDWRDVTCDVRSITVDRGRSSWVEAFNAGTAQVVFANFAGIYSTFPTNSVWRQSAGPVTDVPIRLASILGGDVQWRFTGTTDSVVDSWPDTVDAVATVTATDAFKGLARHNGGPRAAVGAGELSGARINRLADDAGYTGARAVDAGVVALQATTLDGTTIDLMRQVGESEWGWLYIDGAGVLRFKQRTAPDTDPRMTTVQAVFTDVDEDFTTGGGPSTPENIAVAGTPNADGSNFEIANRVTFTAAGTVTKLRYRRRSTSANDLHLRVWDDAGGTFPLRDMVENPAGVGQTGLYEVTLSTPLTVTAGQIYRFAIGSTGPVPYSSAAQTVTNSAHCTFGGYYQTGAAGLYPGTSSGTAVGFYVEPVFEPPGAAGTPVPGACYGDALVASDSDRIVNVAQITPPGHTLSTFADAGSVAWYGPRTWTRTDLPINLDVDAAALAQIIVGGAKADDQRIDAVTIDAAHRPDNYTAAHTVRMTDRIRFIRTFPGGHQLDAELLVYGRRETVTPTGDGPLATWDVTFATGSAATITALGQWDVGTWDDSQWGV